MLRSLSMSERCTQRKELQRNVSLVLCTTLHRHGQFKRQLEDQAFASAVPHIWNKLPSSVVKSRHCLG